MSHETTRHPKYQPIVWATVADAQLAQDYEAAGMIPRTVANEEGYLKVVGARPKAAPVLPYLRDAA